MPFIDVLVIVGGFTVVFHLLKLTWRCWCGFREYVLSWHWQVDLRTYGRWAVVTGATSGIGKAYANELARRGLDVVLVSRSDDKLKRVSKEIEDKYGRKTHTIQADFTVGHSIYPAIAKQLQGLEIGILGNETTRYKADEKHSEVIQVVYELRNTGGKKLSLKLVSNSSKKHWQIEQIVQHGAV